MNTQKAVYNKLFSKKTELETHKIELGLIDESLKWTKGVESFGKNIDIDEKELKQVLNSLEVDKGDLEEDLNALKKGIQQVEKAAQELGLKASSIPKYKDALNVVKYGEKQIAKAKSLLK